MPVNVIGTLKPKNNGKFPVAEAVDIKVKEDLRLDEALENKADLTTVNFALNNKADKTTTTALQSQIDEIAQSQGAGTADTEIAQARVGADGTSYGTLKARLDNEKNSDIANIEYIKDTIYNTDNLLINAKIVKNKYYTNGTATTSASYSYAIVPMLAAKTYVLSRARFIAYSTGAAAAESTNDNYEFSPSADGDVYITFYNDPLLEWKVYEKGKDATLIGTYQHPALGDVLTQSTGTSKTKAISQKAATDAINEAIASIENADVDIKNINEVSIKDGTDLMPLATETGTGYYYYSDNEIKFSSGNDYRYFKLPITGGIKYYLSARAVYIITTDANGDVLDYITTATTTIQTSAGAVMLWVSYHTDYGLTRKVCVNRVLDTIQDTIYLMDDDIQLATTEQDSKYIEKILDLRDNSNIFDTCDFIQNKYFANGFYENSSYSIFVLKAKANVTYTFGCPLRFLYSLSNPSTAIATSTTAGYTYTPQADEILYCTVNNSESSLWKAVAGSDDINLTPAVGTTNLNPDLISQSTGSSKTLLMSQKAITEAIASISVEADVKNRIYGKGYATTTGNLSDGESLTLPATNLKKNNIYSFVGDITTFSKLLIGHAYEGYSGSWVEITSTKLIVHNYFAEDTTVEYTHGLTISDYIYVQIIVKNSNKADVIIYSNGTTFTQSNVYWYGDGNGSTFAMSTGSTLTDCTFTWSSGDFRKSIWLFGDSYFGISDPARWCKYLTDAGYADNVLLNAYSGEGSNSSLTALNNMLTYYGTPDKIVWCLGMNDGSDTNSSTPSSAWTNGISQLISICTANNIDLILATIPTVPNINHEGKNNYVRSSGYRYIDFAKAVGADGTGTWYTGMLSSDNVHPTSTGAKALYHRAIADCPEITFTNP